jgi:maltose O-acetyltransferase
MTLSEEIEKDRSSLPMTSPLTMAGAKHWRQRLACLLHYGGMAVRSPNLITQVLRAQYQLRRCDRVPLTVRLRGRVRVENYGRIEVGDRVRIEALTVPVELVAWRDAILTVGARTFLNYGASLSAHRSVTIGERCLIGNYAVIMDSDYHDLTDRTCSGEAQPIVIEDDVWIGVRAIILKGVRIGRGSVIAAGSVVTKDIPPRSLAAGVPASVIRSL